MLRTLTCALIASAAFHARGCLSAEVIELDPWPDGGAGGSPTTGSTTSTSSASSSGGETSVLGCSPSAPLSGGCLPLAACTAGSSVCAAHVDQSASTTPAFRVAQLSFTLPAGLTSGIVPAVVNNAITPDDATCNINGQGTTSWLLRFDTAAGTLETGVASPSATGPYSFEGSTLTLSAPLGAGCTFDSSAGDFTLPVFIGAGTTPGLSFPQHGLHFHGGAMSGDAGCIGRLNPAAFDPSVSCQASGVTPIFVPGASVDWYATLDELDAVDIVNVNATLCVALAGSTYSDGASPVAHCTRDASGAIVFQGDWCSTTNMPATTGCADALRFSATFAAQAVTIP